MTLRKLIFWPHLIAGLLAAVVILIMSVTGVLLTYEKQMIEWARRGYRSAPPPGAKRLPVETLMAESKRQMEDMPSWIVVSSDPAAPVELGYEPLSFANPYTGKVLGEEPVGVRDNFRLINRWHRWLGAPHNNAQTQRALTGAANLIFLFLVLSGIYLWLPRVWSWQHLRPILWFRGASGKARDFNWHNVFGIWSLVPLFFIALSGVLISYQWATDLLMRATGSPVRKQAPAAPPAASDWEPSPEGLNRVWDQAVQSHPDWKTITFRFPKTEAGPWTFTVDEGAPGQPQKRYQLSFDRATRIVTREEGFAQLPLGLRLRRLARFTHTGEVLGLPGQTVAGIASLGGVFLVYTGVALALRRFAAWRKRRRTPAPKEAEAVPA